METNSDTDSIKSETSNDNFHGDLFGDHSYSKPFVNTAAESRETCPNMMIQGEYEEALANIESSVYQEIQATGQNILKGPESVKERQGYIFFFKNHTRGFNQFIILKCTYTAFSLGVVPDSRHFLYLIPGLFYIRYLARYPVSFAG